MSRYGFALGVELQELLGHVAHRLLDARLRLLPRRPAQSIERWPRAAGVFLNQVQAFDGDEQLVVALVAKLEELLHAPRSCQALPGPPVLNCFSPTNSPIP